MTRWLREVVLWTGAALGALAILLGIAVACFGYSFLIFRSGSMGPGIPTGSLALAREAPAADLRAGDVVSVMTPRGDRVTHRIVSVTLRGDEASLVLQGDANGTPDNEVYVVTEAEREIASVPVAGYVVTVLLSPLGLAGAACLAGMVLVLGFSGGPRDPGGAGGTRPSPPRHRGSHREESAQAGASPSVATTGATTGARVGAAVVAAAVAAGVVVSAAAVAGTSAFFTDPAVVTTGAFTTGTTAPATNVRCVDGGIADFVAWTAPVGLTPTGYVLTFTSKQGDGTVNYGAGITQGRPADPDGGGNRLFTVTISALFGGWTSVVSTTSTTIRGHNVSDGTTWTC